MSGGRKAGFLHNDETRAKIQAAQLINRLQAHVMSKKPLLDASQVNAAKALLGKVLPDLSAVEAKHSGTIETTSKEQRDAAVAAIARADR